MLNPNINIFFTFPVALMQEYTIPAAGFNDRKMEQEKRWYGNCRN
jgi:hypothetical protein